MFVNVVEPLGGNMDVYMSTAMHDHVVGRMEADSDLQAGGATGVCRCAQSPRFRDRRDRNEPEPNERAGPCGGIIAGPVSRRRPALCGAVPRKVCAVFPTGSSRRGCHRMAALFLLLLGVREHEPK